MSLLADLKMYGRFAWGLRGFLRQRMSLEEAEAIVRQRMAERETNFLRLVERGIFGNPRSPYQQLFKVAGCELADLQAMVRAKGLEATLRALREAGVYVSFEEFKGRTPIVRNGHAFTARLEDFDNPYLCRAYQGETGGTTGAGTRVTMDLDHLAATMPNAMLSSSRDWRGAPAVVWFPILPALSGLMSMIGLARFGCVPQKWFSPVTSEDLRPSLKYRVATKTIIAMSRAHGVRLPWPEPLKADRAIVLARWLAETVKAHGRCLLISYVSLAVRVANAAWEQGLDLTGAIIVGGGEPPTPAKVQAITRTGARWRPTYGFTETGAVGGACDHPVDGNDLHFYKDCLALIQYPRQVPGTNITVDAFHFTSLLPTAPKLLLNVESDDYGIVESRSCGCPLESYGFTEHIREIRSFQKLTGEGVTLVGSEMIHILEEVLPARFGGSALDYQLLEEEDEQGFTRLSLIVSPRVALANEQAVIDAVLENLGQGSVSADFARAIWSQAKTLRVKRMDPIWTAAGKLIPLHLAQRSKHTSDSVRSESVSNDQR